MVHPWRSVILTCSDAGTRRMEFSVEGIQTFFDVDDTCMAMRLLRLHGYDISPDVLNKFKDGDQLFCHRGEVDGSPSHMFNLYRCSQVLFPGEKILEEAKNFTYNFLQQCLANNQCLAKWVIAKDIPGEIRYALEFPWYASLPRVEARLYIEQYGGADDILIGKTLFSTHLTSGHEFSYGQARGSFRQ